MSDMWTPDESTLGDLASMDYADLLDSLRKDLQLDASTDLLTGSVLKALVDQNGNSQLAQWDTKLGTNAAQIQVGRSAISVPANASPQGVNIPLNSGWMHNHFVFIASALPSSTWTGVGASGSDTNGLLDGVMGMNNTNTTQVFTFNWISFGN